MEGPPDGRQYDQTAALARQDVDLHSLEVRVSRLEERSQWVQRGQTAASEKSVSWEAFRPVQRIVYTTVAAVLVTLVTSGLGLVVRWLVGGSW